MTLFVLVAGWPGSGKSTLAARLAGALDLPLISKDEIKQALLDVRGPSCNVDASRDLGRSAVEAALLRARTSPGAVIDSTWFPYSAAMVAALPGRRVCVRCVVDRATAERRYRARARDPRLLDDERDPDELWGEPAPLPAADATLDVDTSAQVDVAALAARILAA